MKTTARPTTPDPTFQWTLRLVGVLVVVLSGLFLIKNVGFGRLDDMLLLVCLGLGVITCAAGWLPEQECPASTAA